MRTRKRDVPSVKAILDIDYDHKLSAKDREWLNDFINSEYYANQEAAKKILGRKRSKKARKKVMNEANARRRDAYNRARPVPLKPEDE